MRSVAITTPVLLVALSATAQAATQVPRAHSARAELTAAQARALSRNVTDKVIIVFKNQVAGLPDTPSNAARRGSMVNSVQSQVRSSLTVTHARNVKSFSLVNAISATVSRGEARLLAANSAVQEVIPDRPIPVAASPIAKALRKAAPDAITPLPGACPAKGKVQLDPEAIENIHAATQSGGPSAHGLGYTGAGVKVGYIADGVDPSNPDFIRASGQHVFVDNQDFSGTGTTAPTSGGEAFLDSSSIAAQGRHVYNVAGYGAGLSKPCDIRILGVAPGASLVGLNVFGSANVAFNSVFLEAINYAVNHDHVNVLNESFGDNPFPDTGSLDLVRQADDAAIKAGVTVTVSSGDAGVTNTIGSPATDP
ncbi:MAG: S8 family serine peptidase, partial [Streptosporangiaceae bacterium]